MRGQQQQVNRRSPSFEGNRLIQLDRRRSALIFLGVIARASVALIVLVALAAVPAAASARVTTRHLRIDAQQVGLYRIDQLTRLTVCGPRGRLVVSFRERKVRLPLASGVVNQRAHTRGRQHRGGCRRYTFRWRITLSMAGIGDYRLRCWARIGRQRSRDYTYRRFHGD
jgi:hypothetical protein